MIKKAPEHLSQLFRLKKSSIIQLVLLAVALAVIVPQLKQFSGSWHLLTTTNPSWVLIAGLGMIGTIGFATLVYIILIPESLPYPRTLLIQLATYFTNRLLPSGLGGIGFNALYLVKQAKLSRTDSAVYATANNIIGFTAFSVCIWISTLVADSKIATDVPLKRILFGIAVVAFIVGVIALFVKPIQKRIMDFAGHLLGVLLTIIKHPKRLIFAVLASTGITASYALVLWASTKSVGIHLSIVDIFIAFVAGNAALTISPTPGGIGAVEAAITGVIISAGVAPALALASVVLFRIISYWLPIIPGYIAFRYAIKHGYV
jgi:uncharacterized membrane protein YbhN (UPF0104 family)